MRFIKRNKLNATNICGIWFLPEKNAEVSEEQFQILAKDGHFQHELRTAGLQILDSNRQSEPLQPSEKAVIESIPVMSLKIFIPIIQETKDVELLKSWMSDSRKGIQKAIEERLVELQSSESKDNA